MKQIFTMVIALLCLTTTKSQSTKRISVVVQDSVLSKSIGSASVLLINKTDSFIVATAITDTMGKCTLNYKRSGNYILAVFFIGYEDYQTQLLVTEEVSEVLIKINLNKSASVLSEVVVKNSTPTIKMKGDTIEYRVDSLILDSLANVESLLKQLPGILVDENGKIKANGRKVDKILIEGEEFFSDDPTIVTRSIQANAVQKIQLYDKKTDQAVFSKINDGKSVQALNLKLKPESKKGLLGKLQKASGTGKYYDAQGMLGKFAGSQKLAGYYIASNTGTTGLNWQDQRTYSDFSFTSDEALGFVIPSASSLNTWDGGYYKQGLPTAVTFGLSQNSSNSKGVILNNSIRYGSLDLYDKSTTNQQFFLSGDLYNRISSNISNKRNTSFKIIAKTILPINSNSDFVIGADISFDKKRVQQDFDSRLFHSAEGLLNSQKRQIKNTGTEQTLNSSLLWRKKLQNGITITSNGKFNYFNSTYDGFLLVTDSFFLQGNPSTKQTISDQYKLDNIQAHAFSIKNTVTIPLSNTKWIGFALTNTIYKTKKGAESYFKNLNGRYDIFDTTTSIQYSVNGFNTLLGASYGVQKGKIKVDFKTDIGFTNITQLEKVNNPFKQSFFILLPSIEFIYSITSQHKITGSYTGQPLIPQIDQMAPLVNNADPLNIQIGNANLKPAMRHAANIQYYNFMNEESISFSGAASFHLLSNSFSTSEKFDSLGRRAFQWINTKNIWDANAIIYINAKPIKNLMNLNVDIQFSRSFFRKNVNDIENIITATGIGFSITPVIYQKDKFSFQTRILYNISFTKVNSVEQQKWIARNWIFRPSGWVTLFKQWRLSSDLSIAQFLANSFYGQKETVLRLNAFIGFRPIRNQHIEFRLSAVDLLQNNRGVRRTSYENFGEQATFNTVGNYYLLSLIYNFSKILK
jgi:Outer membrane protein beta-barrel family